MLSERMKIISGVERNLNYTWESERACLWKFLCIWSPKSQPSKEKGLEYSKRKEQQDVFKGLEAGSLWLERETGWTEVWDGGRQVGTYIRKLWRKKMLFSPRCCVFYTCISFKLHNHSLLLPSSKRYHQWTLEQKGSPSSFMAKESEASKD